MKYFYIIIILLILYIISVYNRLVKLRNWVDESWSQIDIQLKRRYDLIPNLVNVVKGYAKHEQETFEKIVEARNLLMNTSVNNENRGEIIMKNDELTNNLKSIFMLHESYPELKANQQFLNLQEELITTENKIGYARQLYNSTVVKYNTNIAQFPNCIMANLFGFKSKEMFSAMAEEKNNVKMEF